MDPSTVKDKFEHSVEANLNFFPYYIIILSLWNSTYYSFISLKSSKDVEKFELKARKGYNIWSIPHL